MHRNNICHFHVSSRTQLVVHSKKLKSFEWINVEHSKFTSPWNWHGTLTINIECVAHTACIAATGGDREREQKNSETTQFPELPLTAKRHFCKKKTGKSTIVEVDGVWIELWAWALGISQSKLECVVDQIDFNYFILCLHAVTVCIQYISV